MNFIRDCWLPILLTLLLFAGFGFLVYAMVKDDQRFALFALEHHCKVVGRMSGDVAVGNVVSSNGSVGIVVTSTPDKTGYACDDGVTYWR